MMAIIQLLMGPNRQKGHFWRVLFGTGVTGPIWQPSYLAAMPLVVQNKSDGLSGGAMARGQVSHYLK